MSKAQREDVIASQYAFLEEVNGFPIAKEIAKLGLDYIYGNFKSINPMGLYIQPVHGDPEDGFVEFYFYSKERDDSGRNKYKLNVFIEDDDLSMHFVHNWEPPKGEDTWGEFKDFNDPKLHQILNEYFCD